MVNISIWEVSNMKLRGDRSVTIDELNAIARELRIGVDEFITFRL